MVTLALKIFFGLVAFGALAVGGFALRDKDRQRFRWPKWRLHRSKDGD
jgi:hypothetical protein